MDLASIRELLPEGSYEKIAEKVGKSKGTVRQFFAQNVRVRISEETEKAIRNAAMDIIEEQKEKAVVLLKEHAAAA